MWKKTLCMAVVGLALTVSAQVDTFEHYPCTVLAAGDSYDGQTYIYLSYNQDGRLMNFILLVQTNYAPHAMDIALAAMSSGKSVWVAYHGAILSGIAMLNEPDSANSGALRQALPQAQEDPVQKMKQLKEMRDTGLITAEEYEAKRQAILSRM